MPNSDWKPHRDIINTKINLAGLHPIQDAPLIRERERAVAEISISQLKVTRLPSGTPTTYEEFQPKSQGLRSHSGQKRKNEISKEEQQKMAKKEFQSKEKSILSDSYADELFHEQAEPVTQNKQSAS